MTKQEIGYANFELNRGIKLTEFQGYPIITHKGDPRDLNMSLKFYRGGQPKFAIIGEDGKPFSNEHAKIKGKIASGSHVGDILIAIDQNIYVRIAVPLNHIISPNGDSLSKNLKFEKKSIIVKHI